MPVDAQRARPRSLPGWLDASMVEVLSLGATVRVLLAEDQALMRQSLRAVLECSGAFEISGEAANGREALAAVAHDQPDVVLLDAGIQGYSAVEVTRQLREIAPSVRVIILTADSRNDQIQSFLTAGASGLVLRESGLPELLRAFADVYRGNSFLDPTIAQRFAWSYFHGPANRTKRAPSGPLSSREREILDLVAEGKGNRQIAELLVVSVKTVEAHKAHIMEKLGLRGSAELYRYALRTVAAHSEE